MSRVLTSIIGVCFLISVFPGFAGAQIGSDEPQQKYHCKTAGILTDDLLLSKQKASCRRSLSAPFEARGYYSNGFLLDCKQTTDDHQETQLPPFSFTREIWCLDGSIRQEIPGENTPPLVGLDPALKTQVLEAVDRGICPGIKDEQACEDRLAADPETLDPIESVVSCQSVTIAHKSVNAYDTCNIEDLNSSVLDSQKVPKSYEIQCKVLPAHLMGMDTPNEGIEYATVEYRVEMTCRGDVDFLEFVTITSKNGVRFGEKTNAALRAEARERLSWKLCSTDIKDALGYHLFATCHDPVRKEELKEEAEYRAKRDAEEKKKKAQDEERERQKVRVDNKIQDDIDDVNKGGGAHLSYIGIKEKIPTCSKGLRLTGLVSAEATDTRKEALELLVFSMFNENPDKPGVLLQTTYTINVAAFLSEDSDKENTNVSKSESDRVSRLVEKGKPLFIDLRLAKEWLNLQHNWDVDNDIPALQRTYKLLSEVSPISGTRFESVAQFSTQFIQWLGPKNAELAARMRTTVGNLNVFYQFGSNLGTVDCVPEKSEEVVTHEGL